MGPKREHRMRPSRHISVFTHFFSTEKARLEKVSPFSRYLRAPGKCKSSRMGVGGRQGVRSICRLSMNEMEEKSYFLSGNNSKDHRDAL